MNKLSELFNIEYGQKEYESKSFLKGNEGNIPLISSGSLNNGVYGKFNIEPKYEKVISVPRTGTICYAVYQKEPCCIDNNCLVLTPKENMTDNEMIYYAELIKLEKFKYIYGRQVTPKRLGNTKVPAEIPNWVYEVEAPDLSKYKESYNDDETPELDVDNWKEFKLADLFDINYGKFIPDTKNRKGKIPYITTTAENNGVGGYVDEAMYEGNCLTVASDGSVGSCFYQEGPFATSNIVSTLKPKKGTKLNKYNAMFFITVIEMEKFRYNYGRKFSVERVRATTIKLPATEDGQPDYQFMEDYIKTLPYSKHL